MNVKFTWINVFYWCILS